ncbi:hypothetical protein A1O1_03480 [Capronia coronata CBS 617.96]|uniref:Xylanolytic transcriptional activator regulatory domain-containing protein n=1 Tax=Capronia coronata CBS 617.96 TaxID=1182541 RepID=W9Z7B4_9EURO|nr:uncharacterized protein A1O1_03480 [Capronia coronata CBS 617.96]EXJ90379.1 hypothetical protein A1O1_03480 [Capronia coronata CBS 617.96]
MVVAIRCLILMARRLTQVEKELREIRQSMRTVNDNERQQIRNVADNGNPTSTTVPSVGHPIKPSQPMPAAEGENNTTSSLPVGTIQGVELASQRINELLNEFFTGYHPYCPILPPQQKFLDYSKPCPLLFWTVLVTALRGKDEDRDLYSTIADAVRSMAYDTIKPASASFHAMQALVLLCQWPLPFQRAHDPSLSFVTLATNIGLRMGLHRPRHGNEYANGTCLDSETEILRRKTWVVCFITNLSVNNGLGLPATVKLDQGLLECLAAKPAWLPTRLHQQLHLSRHALNISSTLGNCESSSTGLLPCATPVIRTFETELRALECQFYTSWFATEYILFLGCRMTLYTFALSADNNHNQGIPGSASSPSRPKGLDVGVEFQSHWLSQAYVTATATIQTSSGIHDQMFHAPSRVQKTLVNAVCFLLLLKYSRHHTLVEHSTLCDSITQGYLALKGLSITPADYISRACQLVDRFGKVSYDERLGRELGGDGDNSDRFLPVVSRMGTNLTLSAVFRARHWLAKTQEMAVVVAATSAAATTTTTATSSTTTFPIVHSLDRVQTTEPDTLVASGDGEIVSFDDINWDELFSEMAGYADV